MIRRLILWDVDGTLVRAGNVGAAVFDQAIEAVFGSPPPERIRMSGKTDPQIVREYLSLMGVGESASLMDAVLLQVESGLAAAAASGELASRGHAIDGVVDVLGVLAADPRVLSSLLTGNLFANAVVKVSAFGLDRWFDLDVGAYGSDHHDRNRLVPVALHRLRTERDVVLAPADVWVVGDTPRDLACARAAGARCLLVATGRYGLSELDGLGADTVLEDLSDTDEVVKILTGDL